MDEDEARAVLGVGAAAGLDEAHDGYLRRARLLHPDAQTSDPALQAEANRAMQQLNEAWAVLRRSVLPAAEPPDGRPGPSGASNGGRSAAGPDRGPEPAAAADPTGAARPVPSAPLPWPALPTTDQVRSMVGEQVARERFVGRDSITEVTEVADVSIATWTLSSLTERRSESWKTFANEFTPADGDYYDTDLNAVVLPPPTGRDESFTLYRTGTLSREACPDCQGGTRRCPTCAGSGSTWCAATVTCSGCSGSGHTTRYPAAGAPPGSQATQGTCPQCGGRGKLPCPRCAGTGRVTCVVCAGRGRVPCTTCKGSGELTRVLVGTVDRAWQSDSEPGYELQSPAAEAAQVADGYADGAWTVQVDPQGLPSDLPEPVSAALPRLLDRAPVALRRRLELTVVPGVRAAAAGSDGAQQVWLIGLPPKLVAPATEEHRQARRNRWISGLAWRVVAAAVVGVAVGAVLTQLVVTPIAVVVGALVALLVGVPLVRPMLALARVGAPVDDSPEPAALTVPTAGPQPCAQRSEGGSSW